MKYCQSSYLDKRYRSKEYNQVSSILFQIPLSGIKIDGNKINYHAFLSSLKYPDCNRALKRIAPKIDLKKICAIINDTPYITDLQKAFYKTMLTERKEKIIDFAFQKLRKRERTMEQER